MQLDDAEMAKQGCQAVLQSANKKEKATPIVVCKETVSPGQDSCWSWVVCFAAVFSNVVICGFTYSYGILFPALLDEFQQGKANTGNTNNIEEHLIWELASFRGRLRQGEAWGILPRNCERGGSDCCPFVNWTFWYHSACSRRSNFKFCPWRVFLFELFLMEAPPPGHRVLIFELPLSKTQFLAYLITELKHLDWTAKRVFQIDSLL